MDLLPSVDLLRDYLVAHDRAVREIIALDQYIEQMSEQTFLSSMGECMNSTLQKMIRISVAEGLKRMYKEYRLQKWLKVQEMAKTVRRVLDAEVNPTELVPQSHQDQIVPVHYNQPPYWQAQNMNLQIPLQDNQNWQPANSIQHMVSPVHIPYQEVISPIQTPNGTDNTTVSRRHVTGATPEEFHQFSVARFSPTENNPASRQLFEDENDIISVECDISSAISEVQEPLHQIIQTPLSGSSVTGQIIIENVTIQNSEENQSVIIPMIQMEQQQIINEHLEESDEEMDWDSDESSYNESEESLAGVLFAAEHLLPDEQAVRLDVEMGDMGIGHMVFDRVSATWFTAHCEFYRAD
ncbi:uncharacterized protein LOC123532286 [Mercenaria mercenaria]|uniref:uncharacterized protein LOC123532286 n=1 Tax=Mercenaria mercenaria TaxID=6596 RepID=UPI00234F18A8|nr:uncharacterized protein LOC123532286 [Mercenaria mercenaria]